MIDTNVAASQSRGRARDGSTYFPFIGRSMMAGIFVLSGIGKIAAPAATIGYIGSIGLPLPAVGYALAIVIELGCGVALLVGFRTRAAALVLAGFTLATAFAFHSALGDQNQFIHFFKNVAMAGGLLQVAAFGAGAVALDRR